MEEEAIAVRPLVARPSTRPVAAALADDLVVAVLSPVGDGGLPIPVGAGVSTRWLAADVGLGISPADGGLPIPVDAGVSTRLLAADVGAEISPADGSFPGPDGGGCETAAPPLVAALAPRVPSLLSPLCAAATSNVTDAASAATVNIPSNDLRKDPSKSDSRTRRGMLSSPYASKRQQTFEKNVACVPKFNNAAVQHQTQVQRRNSVVRQKKKPAGVPRTAAHNTEDTLL